MATIFWLTRDRSPHSMWPLSWARPVPWKMMRAQHLEKSPINCLLGLSHWCIFREETFHASNHLLAVKYGLIFTHVQFNLIIRKQCFFSSSSPVVFPSVKEIKQWDQNYNFTSFSETRCSKMRKQRSVEIQIEIKKSRYRKRSPTFPGPAAQTDRPKQTLPAPTFWQCRLLNRQTWAKG